MAKYALQSSNVFSYTFAAQGASGAHLIVANNNPILNIGGESFTIECWVKPFGNYATYNSIFAKRAATANANSSYQGYLAASNGFMGFYTGIPTGTDYVAVSARPTPNTWNHLAWVFNQGANIRMFLNGTNVFTSTAVTAISNVDSTFSVGAHFGQASQFFGDISNFRIIKGQAIYSGDFKIPNFPFQLSNSSIGYHAGTTNVAASLTGNVILLTCNDQYIKSNGNTTLNSLTVVGDVTQHIVDAKELQNFSYYFPGNTNFQGQNAGVLVTSTTNSLNLNTADFTIETWFYPTKNTGVILERGYGGIHSNLASYILIWDTVNNSVNFASANANNAVSYAVGGLTGPAGNVGAPTLNAWNHIAVARTGTTYRGFLNGTLNLNITTNANNPYDAIGRGLTIGGMFANVYSTSIPSNTISGYISNMRMIRGNSIYNASFTVAQSQLPNVNNTILLTATSAAFEDLSGVHTLAVNGMNQIFWTAATPFTANSTVLGNAASNVQFGATPAAGTRNFKVYDKFNLKMGGGLSVSGRIPNAFGTRNFKVYDKFNLKMGGGLSVSGRIPNAFGTRNFKVYDKFNLKMGGGLSVSGRIPNAFGTRNFKVYNKFNYGSFGYYTFPASSNVSITYQYWS